MVKTCHYLRLSIAVCAAALLSTPYGVSAQTAGTQASLMQVVSFAKKAVVFVVAATGGGAQSGSGFVVSSDASTSTIITANHVIEGTSQIDVIFDSDEHERYTATIVSRDHIRDIAVLSVKVGGRTPLPLDTPKDIQEGMPIAVIGYPQATLRFFRTIEGDALRPSVHAGIVSAVRLDGEIIQFDAPVDHGDSGAPIINATSGKVVAIVRGSPLDPSYAARGLEQALAGTAFGPSSTAISAILSGAPPEKSSVGLASSALMSAGSHSASAETESGADSASYRLGYGIPHTVVTGDQSTGNIVNAAVDASVLDRLVSFLKGENELYLIPLQIGSDVISNSQKLSGYCDDNRLNVIALPSYSWRLTGGPRYYYGSVVGYQGQASVTLTLSVADCYGTPFFVEQQSKSEDRYFAHRTPDREIADMANDVLDKLMNDFAAKRAAEQTIWNNLLKTGLALDPTSPRLYSMMAYQKVGAGYQVVTVVPGGPADQAGVRAQDVIIKINDVDAQSLQMQEIQQKMGAGDFTILVQRPGGTVNLSVHPLPYADIAAALRH